MKRKELLIVLSLCALSLFGQEDSRSVRRFALLVGSNAGGKNRPELKYAEKDARAVSAVMRELGGIASRDERVLFTPDKKSFLNELTNVKHACSATAGKPSRTEFLFYYSGHSDEDGIFLGNEKIAYADLKNLIVDVGAEVNLVVLDSCSSGAITRLKGGTKAPPFLVDESSSMKGHAYLTSSSEFEATQESDKIQGSFFTYYLVAGLRGAADNSGDGKITLNEAYSHAFTQTLARTESTIAGPQHPSYNIRLTGSGDLVLTDMRSAETKMVFDEAIKGRIMVRDGAENLVAETLKNTGKTMDLSLPQGAYSVTLITDGRLLKTKVQLAAGKPQRVGIAVMTPVGMESTARRGTEDGGTETPPRIDPLSLSILSIGAEIDELRIGHRFSLNLIGGKSYAVYGCQLSLGFGLVSTDLAGAQITSGFNYVGRNAAGVQIAAGANIVAGNITGWQLAPINIAAGTVRGVQLGNLNYAGAFDGPQIGVLNIVKSVDGPQLGVLNIAGASRGGQVGVMNVAGEAHGFQLGVLNVFGSNDGCPIGLVNIVLKGGQTHLMTWVDERRYVTAALIHGTRRVYNLYGVGSNLDDGMKVTELGLGYAAELGGFTVNTELVGAVYSPDYFITGGFAETETVLRARMYIGYSFHEHLSLIAGASYNIGVDSRGLGSSAWTSLTWDSLKKWPGFFFGIRL